MKILFLDFDGVLHPSIANANEFFSNIKIFDEGIRELPVKIVISSSWRFQYSINQLKKLLGPNIGTRVIDVTGDAHIGKYARFEEINTWIRSNECQEWVILDDSKFEFPENVENLILCDSRVGITREVMSQLNSLLNS